jgi:hypothetical protein
VAEPIEAESALTAVNLAGGLIDVGSTTRNGRVIIAGQHPDWVRAVVTEAVDLQWDADDPAGLCLHATTPLGRLYRVDTVTTTMPGS